MSFGEPRGSEVRTADSLSTEQRRLIHSIFLSAALVAERTYGRYTPLPLSVLFFRTTCSRGFRESSAGTSPDRRALPLHRNEPEALEINLLSPTQAISSIGS